MTRRTLNMMCRFVLPVVLLLWHGGRPIFAQTTPSSAPTSAPLTFTVQSSKHTYTLTEPVVLTLTLSLGRRAPMSVTVATFYAGTISVVKATQAKQNITPLERFIAYVEDPQWTLVQSLRTIAPGQSVTIPFAVAPDLNGGALVTTVQFLPNGLPSALVFPLTATGSYTLQFEYQYTGPDGGQPNVFREAVLSNEVNFRLH